MSAQRFIAFLDRDGTVIETDVHEGLPVAIQGSDRVALVPGAEAACARLKSAGYLLVLVTNQPDVARGLVSRSEIDSVNNGLADTLCLDLSLTCYHDDLDGCDCRKPAPGLLITAAAVFDVNLDSGSVMIGDRWRDIDAGHAAGVSTVFLDRGYAELLRTAPDYFAESLTDAADWVLDRRVTTVRS